MAKVWLVRAGRRGERESRFLADGMAYIGWGEVDLTSIEDDHQAVYRSVKDAFPEEGRRRLGGWAGQLLRFRHWMQKGDWVVTPSKLSPAIYMGRVAGDYEYHASEEEPYRHRRKVDWEPEPVPRSHFDQDLLYSLGTLLTVASISRNNAAKRIEEMAEHGWKVPAASPARLGADTSASTSASSGAREDVEDESDGAQSDMKTLAADQVTRLVVAKFKGHGLASLVGEILEAEGYIVHQPPEGPDRGIDLVASSGRLGFGEPRICVQVKSQDSPVDRPEVQKLQGTMADIGASHGLFVSWSGFKRTVEQERSQRFFQIRLWDSGDILKALYRNYDKLPEATRADIPLQQIWVPVPEED